MAGSPLAAVTLLEPLERFVFVMTLLEGYSEHECAVFLNRSRSDVVAARTRALQQLANYPGEEVLFDLVDRQLSPEVLPIGRHCAGDD